MKFIHRPAEFQGLFEVGQSLALTPWHTGLILRGMPLFELVALSLAGLIAQGGAEPTAQDQLREANAVLGGSSSRSTTPKPPVPSKTAVTGPNAAVSGWTRWSTGICREKKKDILEKRGKLSPGQCPRPYEKPVKAGVGEYAWVPDPLDQCVGSEGAGACIGIIFRIPIKSSDQQAGESLLVFHFSAVDDPAESIKREEARYFPAGFPPGTRAALFGGDGGASSDVTLECLDDYLREALKGKVAIDGYANHAGLWVQDGSYCLRPSDRSESDNNENDP